MLIGSEKIAVSARPQVAMHSQLPPFLVIIFYHWYQYIIPRDLKNMQIAGNEEAGIVVRGENNPTTGGGSETL